MRCMFAFVMLAVVLGCSSAGGGSARSDARGSAARTIDACADRAASKDAASADATVVETGPRDATLGDARQKDAVSRDASSGEVGQPDTGLGDRVASDAGLEESGSRDATLADAADAGSDGAPPTATTISVSPLTLTPPFSTRSHDYYVRCAEGRNTLEVSMTAAPGSTIALVQPFATGASTHETATVSVGADDLILVAITTDGGTAPYWIRCLPHDFPRLQMIQHPDAGTPTPGYYLVGNIVVVSGVKGYAMALDVDGVPIWYRRTMNGVGAADVDSIVSGTISFASAAQPSFAVDAGQFEIHDLVDGSTSHVAPVGMPFNPHELQALPNGDYVMIAVVDPYHCNSIDLDMDGNLLVSARQMNSIFMVSKSTGAILWKMGGATFTRDGAPYIALENDPMNTFHGQHDARLLPEGGGSLFDDQTGHVGPARAVAYAIDADAGTASVVWQYAATESSASIAHAFNRRGFAG